MADVLVVGAGGQLGRALARRAQPSWALLDRRQLDLTDGDAVRAAVAAFRPRWVVNAAAWTGVDAAEADEAGAYAVNAAGPAVLAEAADAAGAGIVQVSTDYVFDGSKGAAYVEGDAVGPLGAYGRTKLAGEVAVARVERHVILRTAWVFGPDRPGFLGAMLQRAREGASLRAVADQQGSPTPVDGLADAVVAVMAHDRPWGTWHVAGEPGTTWHGLLSAALAAVGSDVEVTPIAAAELARPAPRPADGRLCSDAFAEAFGLRIRWEEDVPAVARRWWEAG